MTLHSKILKKTKVSFYDDSHRLLDICHGRMDNESKLNLVLVFEYVERDLDYYLKKNNPLPPATIQVSTTPNFIQVNP